MQKLADIQGDAMKGQRSQKTMRLHLRTAARTYLLRTLLFRVTTIHPRSVREIATCCGRADITALVLSVEGSFPSPGR